MITIHFKKFGRWQTAGTRENLGDARRFVAVHAPLTICWADSVRFIVDGTVVDYETGCRQDRERDKAA